MNLQPLYDVKARLEAAAIAGTGLLGEDFRLKRAAEGLKPLAAASPVFGKIDAGLEKLLSAPAGERSGLLLDMLALVDAVAYTQAKTGIDGELAPLPAGHGQVQELSYSQLSPLLSALTGAGGGRMNQIKDTWEVHPEFFGDFRVLPALVSGLGESYAELAELNTTILKAQGPAAIPLLKEGFDPAGKKAMARRVEVISAIEGAEAAPWLREVLPQAKKDARAAVIIALGADPENTSLLLDLSKTERGTSREAVLTALARLDGDAVRAFWTAEVQKTPEHVEFLRDSSTDWASDLAAAELRAEIENLFTKGEKITPEDRLKLNRVRWACMGKTSPAMLDCWRWMDRTLNNWEKMKGASGQLINLSGESVDWLLDSLCDAGPGPLCGLCWELWDQNRDHTRYIPHALLAALLTRPAAEVYDTFARYIPVSKLLSPKGTAGQSFQSGVLRGLERLTCKEGAYLINDVWPTFQPLDSRWIERLTHAVCKPEMGHYYPFGGGDMVDGFDKSLMELADPEVPEQCAQLIPYLRQRMVETGSWYSYSRYLLRFGGSPREVLGRAIKKGKDARLYYVWQLLSEASRLLPAEEVAGLCQEVLSTEHFRPVGDELFLAKKVLPWTIQQLQAGQPFPEWDVWWKMR